jgi:hypothetical protein
MAGQIRAVMEYSMKCQAEFVSLQYTLRTAVVEIL